MLFTDPVNHKALLIAFALSGPALAGEWTERYFGVGSASDKVQACGLARDHAQGNSNRACVDRSGTRGGSVYTDCICTSAAESMQICNVNLKVLCDGPNAGSDPGSLREGGPKGRAGQRRTAPGRPGSEVKAAR